MEQPTEQIEQFIGMLRTTSAQVEDGLHHVESDSAALDHLAADLHDQLAGLGHELEGMLSELAHDEQAAVSELDHLGDAAHAAADTRLAAGLDELAHAESALEQSLEAVGHELDQDAGGLHDQGFQPLATTVHAADGAADAARSHTEQAFAALDAAVQSLLHELQAAATEVDHSLIAAAAILGDEDKHGLETAAHDCVAGLHELVPETDAAGATLGEESEHLYQGWTQEADHEAHELEEALTTLFEGSAQAVAVAGTEKIADPAEKVEGEAVPALLEELEEQVATLTAGHEAATELVPLAAELEVTSGVIGTINDLINSMGE